MLVGPDAKLIDVVSRLPAGLYQRTTVFGAKAAEAPARPPEGSGAVSGPVTEQDAALDAECGQPEPPEVELLPAREAEVGGLAVRRALPRRARRTVGAWCFADQPDNRPPRRC